MLINAFSGGRKEMSSEGFKLYGLCLERLKHQIELAKARYRENPHIFNFIVTLECYRTGDVDEIVDILELYNIDSDNMETVMERLEDLARDASLLVRDTVEFGFSDDGFLSIYLSVNGKTKESLQE